jgi:hypothetical protein
MFPSPSKVALAFGSFLFLNACSTQGGYPLSAPPASAEKDSFQKSAVEKSVNQQAVAYQIDTAHTGFAKGPLRLPLQQLWPVKLPVLYRSVGFPTVANGVVVVTAYNKLIALDEKTGKKVWSHSLDYNENSWIGQAYDNGTIFASPAAAANRKAWASLRSTKKPESNCGQRRRDSTFRLRRQLQPASCIRATAAKAEI